jgi:hypothetical protein
MGAKRLQQPAAWYHCPSGRRRLRSHVTPVWCAEIALPAGTTMSAPVRAAKASSGRFNTVNML